MASDAVPGLTRCTGGTSDTASDPWVSFGGDGTAYFGGQFGVVAPDPPEIAIGASRSADGGRHWSAPATISPRLPGNETPAVTGSPTRRGHAYMVWAKFFKVIPAPMEYTLSFSRTTDGGTTWSAPVVDQQAGMFGSTSLLGCASSQRHVAGRLRARRRDLRPRRAPGPRSLDEGQTWLPPVVAGSIPIPPPEVILPETGEQLPNRAIRPRPWHPTARRISRSSTAPHPTPARSACSSRATAGTWKSSTLPGVPAFAWEPAMAVDGHNTVGVIWYDLRNDRPGDAVTSADVWFAQSDDHGASWRQPRRGAYKSSNGRASGPESVRRIPGVAGLQGLRGELRAFRPQARNGPTDIFFARIVPGRGATERRGGRR